MTGAMLELVAEPRRMTFLDPQSGAPVTRGAELRVDPLTGETARVFDFPIRVWPAPDLEALARQTRDTCPFCPERLERATPRFPARLFPEGRLREGTMVVVPNHLPYDLVCAVAVLGPRHLVRLPEMEPDWLAAALALAQRFHRALAARSPAAAWRSVNWNFMPPSGGSLVHPHLQLVAGDRPYRFVRTLLEAGRAYRTRTGRTYWADLLELERRQPARLVGATGPWTWLTAFAPRGRFFELLALHERAATFEELAPEELAALAAGLARALRALDALGFWAFNLTVASAADPQEASFRVQLRLTPRLALPPTGMSDVSFPFSQGEFLVFYRPEAVAARLRAAFAGAPAAAATPPGEAAGAPS